MLNGFVKARACGCTETVSKPLPFGAMELCLSEKQIPQVVVFMRSRQNEESV